jgi:hypothetical protein
VETAIGRKLQERETAMDRKVQGECPERRAASGSVDFVGQAANLPQAAICALAVRAVCGVVNCVIQFSAWQATYGFVRVVFRLAGE